MITDAARKVASLAAKRAELPLGKPSFRPPEFYKAKEFDAKNFRPIILDKTQDPRPKTQDPGPKTAFLDGGNLCLIDAPSFAVHFERVYVNCFHGSERINLKIPSKLEFFVVVTSEKEVDDITYATHLIPLNEEHKKFFPDEKDLVFDIYDNTIKEGQEQIQIARMGDIARSFAEWNYASFVNRELETGDLFVRDGTLHAPYTNQSKYAEKAYEAARRNGVLFCGVSKTSHLYTTTGLSLVAAIGRMARENRIKAPGYYTNIVEITDPSHKADLSFARFHARAQNTFRVEILKGQEAGRDKMMSLLAENSRDISFFGYPYGLVDADKNARVSYEELDALRMLLLSEISKTKGFDAFKDLLSGGDAHERLNNIV